MTTLIAESSAPICSYQSADAEARFAGRQRTYAIANAVALARVACHGNIHTGGAALSDRANHRAPTRGVVRENSVAHAMVDGPVLVRSNTCDDRADRHWQVGGGAEELMPPE